MVHSSVPAQVCHGFDLAQDSTGAPAEGSQVIACVCFPPSKGLDQLLPVSQSPNFLPLLGAQSRLTGLYSQDAQGLFEVAIIEFAYKINSITKLTATKAFEMTIGKDKERGNFVIMEGAQTYKPSTPLFQIDARGLYDFGKVYVFEEFWYS